MNWTNYSFLTALILTVLLLIVKYLLNNGIGPATLNFFILSLSCIGFGYISFTKENLLSNINILTEPLIMILIVIVAILEIFGNYFNFIGIKIAPNPGYHLSIAMSRFAVVALLSVFLFNSDFSLIKFFGIILMMVGSIFVLA